MREPLAKSQLLSSLGLPKEDKSEIIDKVLVCAIQKNRGKYFIALNRMLWAKAINILHWFLLNQLEKIKLKYHVFQ